MIEEGLEQSRALGLCMSANAFGSDWVQLEAGTFRFRDPLNQDRRFIPLRLDHAASKMVWNLPTAANSKTISHMKIGWIYKDGEVIQLPSLTAVIQKEESWYVSTCPELGVATCS